MLRQVHRALCDLIHRESKIIILNVHENASDFENEFVQQITLRESCDPRFESSFPKVRHQLISVDDEQQERSRLARKMEHAGKKRFGWRERLLLIPRYALMIAAFVAGATLIQFLLMRLDASMLADIDPFVLAFLDHTSVTSLFVCFNCLLYLLHLCCVMDCIIEALCSLPLPVFVLHHCFHCFEQCRFLVFFVRIDFRALERRRDRRMDGTCLSSSIYPQAVLPPAFLDGNCCAGSGE